MLPMASSIIYYFLLITYEIEKRYEIPEGSKLQINGLIVTSNPCPLSIPFPTFLSLVTTHSFHIPVLLVTSFLPLSLPALFAGKSMQQHDQRN